MLITKSKHNKEVAILKAEIERLEGLKKVGTQENGKVLVFNEDGIKIWSYENLLNLKSMRAGQLSVAQEDYRRGVSRFGLIEIARDIRELVNAGDVASISMVAGRIESYLTSESNYNMLFGICNCIYLLDGEPEEEVLNEYTKKKWKLFNENPKVRSFFLSTGLRMHQSITGSLKEPMDTSLNQAELKTSLTEEIFSNYLTRITGISPAGRFDHSMNNALFLKKQTGSAKTN